MTVPTIQDASTDLTETAAVVLPDVPFTQDWARAGRILETGGIAFTANPPTITLVTYDTLEISWPLVLATGPTTEPHKALTVLAPVLADVLEGWPDVTEVRPGSFAAPNGQGYPCYTFTYIQTITS